MSKVITDPVADFLTRIRNAGKARHASTEMPSSHMKERLAEVFKREGYISGFEVLPGKPRKTLRIFVRYRRANEPMITEVKRVSKPGCRTYASTDQLNAWKNSIETMVLSTSRGILTHRQALEANVGGEVLLRMQ